MSRRRILHVVFSSRLAGSERYCVDLANRQAAAGHEVHMAGMQSSALVEALSPEVHFHGFHRLFRKLFLSRLIRRLSPNVCHGHLSAACKALGRIPGQHQSVATLHVGYKPHQHSRLNGLICVNRAQSTRLSGYSGQVRTISNWPPQPLKSAASGIRADLRLNPDVFLVGAIGRLHESKGMDVLISAFRAVAPAGAALVILGEGPQRAKLEQLCEGDPRIHLPGHRPVVHGCLREFDLFVSPSREESFGLAILEAMSAGVPIVATAAEGPAEFLQNQPVELVAPGSVSALATALAAASERFASGQLPRLTYDLSLYEPSDRVADIVAFYDQVLEARQNSRVKRWVPVPVTT